MLIKRRKGWEIPEREVTAESLYLNRRQILAGTGLTIAGGIAGGALIGGVAPAHAEADPSEGLYPAPRNEKYKIGPRPITAQKDNEAYTNFYEFRLGSAGDCRTAAEKLPIRPWDIKIDGLVEKEFTIGIDDLLKKVTLEERVYRHRCVETWAMTVPWTGFPMASLVALAKPTSAARFVRMETFLKPDVAPNQRNTFSYDWPYVEGLTLAEATNELAFVVTGSYGKPVGKSMGAPIRIHLPWKYGFKSIKSVVKFTFTADRPVNWWQGLQAREYGFWANVNPEVAHPRWSQANERLLSGGTVPTVIYNGYGEFVADLYKDIRGGENLFK
ncbi:MAG: protein-methionine-sulfoxide reductase catalytic subunit MsrP [Bauldia sp.]